MGRPTSPIYSSCPCPRPLELWSGPAVERGFTPGGIEIAPSNREYDLERIRASRSGPLCISGEHSLPIFLFPDVTIHLGRGCARPPLAEDVQICISACKAPPSSAVQDQGGEGNRRQLFCPSCKSIWTWDVRLPHSKYT